MTEGAGRVVLAIDTAGPEVGLALGVEGRLVEAWSQRVARGADTVLLPAMAAMLERAAAEGLELDRVAVSVGPGTFTGLRVGVAAALGLALARGLPVVAWSSLAARACLLAGAALPVFAVLDARKGRVYAGLFEVGGEGATPLAPERDASLEELLPPAPFLAVGEGALAFAARIQEAGGTLVAQAGRCPAPAMACAGPGQGERMDPGALALRYLRDADAIPPSDLGQRQGHRG